MRCNFKILIIGKKLNTKKSKQLLNIIQGMDGIDGIVLKTGLEYDALIEEDEDSETAFLEISFYGEGDEESGTVIVNKAVNLIKSTLKFSEKAMVVTMTDCEGVHFFF
jgi:hypothetical protein